MNNPTPKRDRFVIEYLIDLNATQAALRAGYSPHTAKTQGSALLAMPEIRAKIDKAMASRAARTEIKADDVIAMLASCYKEARAAAQYGAAIRAAELLGKHLGLFVERHEHTGRDGNPIEVDVDNARERLAASIAGFAAKLAAQGGDGLPN